ncbi:PEP-utilizing enzyme [Mycobacterium sp. TY815]|uniref:PEP-utilizing enzyme n=1 Tax=Mycobacterium sp. TY815 TaxID=3050581 RepID=UPI00274240E6|nr:PEP-utilizing enzyme [Mycobacterium sp. TY815]MDP7704808.1 PEP-utilizing enzyme [Mycobacterium sp. TY815]
MDIEDFITDEWYPGFAPSFGHSPYIVEPFRSFSAADKQRFWFLDFHWARGLTPLGMIWNEDGYSWGTQWAAEQMPLPAGRGMTQRIAGTHTYAAVIPVRNKREIAARDKRVRAYLPGFLDRFDLIWRQRRSEIEIGWQALRSRDVSALSDEELAMMLVEARTYYRRLFEIHFEMMYPLISNYLGFRGVCRELGIETATVAKFLQGYETKISETDRALWKLAADARSGGVEPMFAATPTHELAATLQRDADGRRWLQRLAEFLDVYGYRTAGTADVALPSWIEDPTPVLGTVAEFLRQKTPHDFDAAHTAAVEEREAAVDEARGRLARREQQVFDAGLISVQHANFPWWQDDHNYYIDLRASLPVRWVALELAQRLGTDRYDDTMFLFWPELVELAERQRGFYGLQKIIEARRQYFDHWHDRRSEMPKVLGAVPDVVDDPLLIEIYGLDRGYMDAVRGEAAGRRTTTLRGMPAARGCARGRARVLREADHLNQLAAGEILVCESTSASWTSVFSRIAGCVCDSGGALSHAAIVGREYGVPTVTACGVATSTIRDGDEIVVDGAAGTVTILRECL